MGDCSMDQKRTPLKTCAPFLIIGTCIIDSFLLDPFLLFLCGLIIVWLNVRIFMKKGGSYIFHLSALTLALFWIISLSLYFNLPWVVWMAKLCRAQNGRDWMINSGVFHFNVVSPPEITLVISGFLFATYPLWLWLGIQAGYILFGRKPSHKGLMSLFYFR